ncbi:CU044_5270 family protein [Nonomuraea sp. NPDC048892]|uniref:CU044_5270 family protein n=1 Tax=Nonomuraea sp. NPDC048892 TaxID=3154624 RepID=UPI0033E7CF60
MEETMEELRELRRHHDAQPEPAPRTVDAARARLNAHMRGDQMRGGLDVHMRSGLNAQMRGGRSRRVRRVRPMWGLSLAGAAATAVAVAVTVVPGAGVDPRTSPAPPSTTATTTTELRLRPVADAQDVADNAALLAGAEAGWAISPTQWSYVKSVRAQTRPDGGEWLRGRPKETVTHEQWRRFDDKAFATVEQGRLKVHKGSEFEVTYAYLLALPTEADQLLARVYATVDEEDARHRESLQDRVRQRAESRGKSPEEAERIAAESTPELQREERDRWAFQLIAMGMRDAALPPRLRAAMYGALAAIPGVRYEDTASDLLKRRGVTLYHVLDGYLRDEIFIDPETYVYLGYRTVVVANHKEQPPFGDVWKKGEIRDWNALVEAAVVRKAGQRPG